ncbi:DinB family protein [Nocardioides sp. KR10-350]|uniref:DinB family protein n=1 Tax=Nocardioides cheoyonin TaxID=3156615 RepID=UPI0032B530C7
MPAHAPVAPDERSALVGFLHQQQDAFRNAAYGLTDAQAGMKSSPSELRIGTLVKHLTLVSEDWLAIALAAPEKALEHSGEEAYEEWLAAFRWGDDETLEAALAAYDDVCGRVLDAVRTLDLDTPAPVPDAPWFPKDVEAWSVRWVWFHLFEELARHAGHADIIREGIDGAQMIELLAGREGWPETPWVKPWQPPVGV